MSLFDKLFGAGTDKKVEKAAKGIMKDFDDVFGDLARSIDGKSEKSPEEPAPEKSCGETREQYDSPSGDSWGETMPAEENQFNYGGSFEEYFEHIFKEDFGEYSFDKLYVGYGKKRVVYRFSKGTGTALTLELMSQSCQAKMTRRECEMSGTPYLRFYYDHHGWWNTRSYVVKRMRAYL